MDKSKLEELAPELNLTEVTLKTFLGLLGSKIKDQIEKSLPEFIKDLKFSIETLKLDFTNIHHSNTEIKACIFEGYNKDSLLFFRLEYRGDIIKITSYIRTPKDQGESMGNTEFSLAGFIDSLLPGKNLENIMKQYFNAEGTFSGIELTLNLSLPENKLTQFSIIGGIKSLTIGSFKLESNLTICLNIPNFALGKGLIRLNANFKIGNFHIPLFGIMSFDFSGDFIWDSIDLSFTGGFGSILGDLSLPNLNLPSLHGISLGSFPGISLPNISLPEFNIPEFSFGDLSFNFKEWSMWDISLKYFTHPDLSVDLPDIKLGNLKFPEMSLFDFPNFDLDSPDIDVSLVLELPEFEGLSFTWGDLSFNWPYFLGDLTLGDLSFDMFTLPGISLPSLNFGDLDLPNFNFPDISLGKMALSLLLCPIPGLGEFLGEFSFKPFSISLISIFNILSYEGFNLGTALGDFPFIGGLLNLEINFSRFTIDFDINETGISFKDISMDFSTPKGLELLGCLYLDIIRSVITIHDITNSPEISGFVMGNTKITEFTNKSFDEDNVILTIPAKLTMPKPETKPVDDWSIEYYPQMPKTHYYSVEKEESDK